MTTRLLQSIIISEKTIVFEKKREKRRNAENVGEVWRTRGGKRSEGERKNIILHLQSGRNLVASAFRLWAQAEALLINKKNAEAQRHRGIKNKKFFAT